jgi:hypothetical protein
LEWILLITLGVYALFSTNNHSQERVENSKIIDGVKDEIVEHKEPFALSYNPTRLLSVGSSPNQSGGVSYCNYDENYEIALPLFWERFYDQVNSDSSYKPLIHHELSVDIEYNQYLNHENRGFNYGPFLRYRYIHSMVNYWDHEYEYDNIPFSPDYKFEHSLAIGYGIGYRKVFTSGLFINFRLKVGAYVSGGENGYTSRASLYADPIILETEIFKIGYLF